MVRQSMNNFIRGFVQFMIYYMCFVAGSWLERQYGKCGIGEGQLCYDKIVENPVAPWQYQISCPSGLGEYYLCYDKIVRNPDPKDTIPCQQLYAWIPDDTWSWIGVKHGK